MAERPRAPAARVERRAERSREARNRMKPRAFAVGAGGFSALRPRSASIGSRERMARRALSPGAGGPLRLRPVFDPVRPQAILSPRRAARSDPRRAPPLAWRPVAWTTPDVVTTGPVGMSTSSRVIVRRLRPSFPARPIPAAASVSGSETPLLRWRRVKDRAGMERRGQRPTKVFPAPAPFPSSRLERGGERGPKLAGAAYSQAGDFRRYAACSV